MKWEAAQGRFRTNACSPDLILRLCTRKGKGEWERFDIGFTGLSKNE